VRETPISGKPEVVGLVSCNGKNFCARYAIYGHKPAVLEICKSEGRESPNAAAMIAKQ
jgi:hypothetical protein